ncbi:MAG: hypothetical protein R6U20_12725 [Longimonas sp.]|uniref:hypothetical protein n=1 Tax=Longimonas sp. TaxID=2039626 RepID=UPI003976EAC4
MDSQFSFSDIEPFRRSLNRRSIFDTDRLDRAIANHGRYNITIEDTPFQWERPYFGKWENSQKKRWEMDGEVVLDGPVKLMIGHKACEIHFCIPYHLFLGAPGVRHALRQIYFTLAQEFNSPRALYITDNSSPPSKAFGMTGEKKSLHDIYTYLCDEVGKPLLDPQSPHSQLRPEQPMQRGNWWFEDDFSDFIHE